VGSAQALLTRAPVLLLDEPTAGLDPTQVIALRALLLTRRDDGAAILWSSHVTAEIEAVVDDVVVIHQGRTVHAGDKTTLPTALHALTLGAAA
jgi:ABC-2 type transport system ATP-binding protein